ncbi:MAG: hypothetical protein IKG22_14550, partial [Atopobiaceae bacterium]|nr:hypothetical protein [Atopobiaceae bacterium]
MRRPDPSLTSMVQRILSLFMSITLVVQGIPAIPAHAEEVEVATDEVACQAVVQNDDLVYEAGTLAQTAKTGDDRTYQVAVTYDESACIPQGAELHARVLGEDDKSDEGRQLRQLRLEQVLELGERERILGEQYLELWIEHEGQVIEPASSVDILVET